MKRLLPFQDENPHEVLNGFRLNTANTKISDSGDGDDGVFVKVASGTITNDPVEFVDSPIMVNTSAARHLGINQYPQTVLAVGKASAGDMVLGITLRQTALQDENGESLNSYRAKLHDIGAVLSGQSVPVAKRGVYTLSYRAFGTGAVSTYVPTPGQALVIGATAGCATGIDYNDAVSGHYQIVGSVLATGLIDGTPADGFEGAYAVINLAC